MEIASAVYPRHKLSVPDAFDTCSLGKDLVITKLASIYPQLLYGNNSQDWEIYCSYSLRR
jgi:hypothetical protein